MRILSPHEIGYSHIVWKSRLALSDVANAKPIPKMVREWVTANRATSLPVVIIMMHNAMMTVVNYMVIIMVVLSLSGPNGHAERKNDKKRKQNLLHRVISSERSGCCWPAPLL
jgi:hypothetical protein